MANDYRDRDRSHGMFGYEGEGYMRGGGRDMERGFYDRGYDRDLPPSFRGRGPKGYQRSDERIREDVCERLTDDDYVDASDIEVTVAGGTVTLAGTVDDRGSKRRAEDVVESVTGVKDVLNQLRVSPR